MNANTRILHPPIVRSTGLRLRHDFITHSRLLGARQARARAIRSRRADTLPEGTAVDLVAEDEGDDLTDDDCRARTKRGNLPRRVIPSASLGYCGRAAPGAGEPVGPNHTSSAPVAWRL